MADKRISQLVDRGTVANNDVVAIVVSGAVTTNKATISSIQTFMQGNLDVGVTSVGITLGSTGTDVSVSGSPVTSSGNITINIPSASATNRGLVTTGAQTIAGNKTTTSNINVNGVYVGRGASGGDLFAGIAGNTSVGSSALISITTGFPNTALGSEALRNITTGANNIAIGSEAGKIDSGSSTANATSSSSIYIGDNTKPQTNGNTNEIVIGHAASGNGSNTVTIGNSSTTFNKFFGATQSDTFRLPSDGGGNQVTVFENIGTIHQGTASLNNFGFNNSNNIYFGKGLSNGGVIQFTNAAVRYYTLPDADGTIALTSDLSGYVTLATAQTITAQKTFTGSGGSDTMIISHGSGSGFALDVIKAGNGEVIRVLKTSGSGNAMTVQGGNFEAPTIVKTGGTSAQFLMADGSVNTSVLASGAYLPLAGGSLSTTNTSETLRIVNGGTGYALYVQSNSYFQGDVRFQNASNSILKTVSGLLTAAVAGTDYVIPSALSAYLPLTGGTLTGALNGTSAVFSNSINGEQSLANNNPNAGTSAISVFNLQNNVSVGQLVYTSSTYTGGYDGLGANTYALINRSGTGAFKVITGGFTDAQTRLTIASTGAATFSSSVTATSATFTGNLTVSGASSAFTGGAIEIKGSANAVKTLFINRFGVASGSQHIIRAANAHLLIETVNNEPIAFIGGNVGIGTAGPATFLHVAGTSTKVLTGLFHTCIQDFTTMAAGVGGGITFMGYKTAQSAQEAFAGIDGFKENGTSGNAAGAFRILTQQSSGAGLVEQMRITSSGNVGIGTTTPTGHLEVESSGNNNEFRVENTLGSTYTEIMVYLNNYRAASSAYNFLTMQSGNGAATMFNVRGDGQTTIGNLGTGTVSATSGVLSTASDSSYKVDDGFIDSALDKVLNLKPRYFYWNEKSGLPTDIRQLGFYAQEVNEALGEEAANTPQDENTSWGIMDRSVIAMLTKAIQELKTEIDSLKNQIK